jgi:hypothetical protein
VVQRMADAGSKRRVGALPLRVKMVRNCDSLIAVLEAWYRRMFGGKKVGPKEAEIDWRKLSA